MNLNARTRPKWILASASPRRKEILERLGLRFRVIPSGIQEPGRSRNETPSNYAVRIARLKSAEIAKQQKSGLIIGVDTIVVQGTRILGKPENASEAKSMLRRLSGRWHEVISGICLTDCREGRTRSGFGLSRVHFRRLSEDDLDWYVKTGEYCDKAGAYGIQGYASLFTDRIEGCYFNIVGFPLAAFQQLCRKSGINLINELRPAETDRRTQRPR